MSGWEIVIMLFVLAAGYYIGRHYALNIPLLG